MKKLKDIDTNSVNEIVDLTKKILKLVYIVLIVLLIVGAIYIGREMYIFDFIFTLLKVLLPFFAGFVLAWIFSPMVDTMQKKGISRLYGSLIIYAGLCIVLGIFFSLFVPVILNQISDFVAFLPSVVSTLTNFINETLDNLSATGMDTESIRLSLNDSLTSFSGDITSSLPENAMGFAGSFFSGFVDVIFSLIIGLYILVDFDRVRNGLLSCVPYKNKEECSDLITKISTETRKTVNGILLIASMVFVCDTVGFAIIGLEASLLLGLFCGITDLIPFVGPYIGGGIAVIVGFSQGPVVGVGVLIITVLVQAIENYVLQPVVMSKATNIHPVIIIVSLLVFGYFFGIVGMILSTPILSIIKVIFIHFNEKYNLTKKSLNI